MCGSRLGGRYGNWQVFELTSTKGAYWQRFCARDGCLASAPSAVTLNRPAFTVVHDGGNVLSTVIAHRLNSRPRKTLGFMTPSRKLSEPLQ
jgi:hypothetical protein